MTRTRLRSAVKQNPPGIEFERGRWDAGDAVVAGIDEVGRGSWAGPLTLAAVVIPRDRRLYKIRDSKMLRPSERESMHDRVREWASHVAVAHVSAQECDALGMSQAQKVAASRALDALGVSVDHVLVDGNWDFVESVPVTTLVKGDARSVSIAAASIVAKVTRDRLMRGWHTRYPPYAFASNKGYPCARHKAALAAYGPSQLHRRRWSFVDDLRWTGVHRVAGTGGDGPQTGLF